LTVRAFLEELSKELNDPNQLLPDMLEEYLIVSIHIISVEMVIYMIW